MKLKLKRPNEASKPIFSLFCCLHFHRPWVHVYLYYHQFTSTTLSRMLCYDFGINCVLFCNSSLLNNSNTCEVKTARHRYKRFLNRCVPVYLTKLPVSHVDQITSCDAFWKIFSHPRFFLSTISYNIIDYNSYMHDEIEMYAMQWNASDIGVGINTTF